MTGSEDLFDVHVRLRGTPRAAFEAAWSEKERWRERAVFAERWLAESRSRAAQLDREITADVPAFSTSGAEDA